MKRTEKPPSQLLALAEKLAAWAGLVYTLPFKRVRVETVAFGVSVEDDGVGRPYVEATASE